MERLPDDTAMKVFIYHENASGKYSFTRTGDAHTVAENLPIFAVADSPIRRLVLETKRYPHDDHGYDAAKTFTDSFVNYARSAIENNDVTESTVHDILKHVNAEIRTLNISLGKQYGDPLNYDVAETVGMGAFVYNGRLFYGGLEDCYVNVLRGGTLDNVAPLDFHIVRSQKYMELLHHDGKFPEYVPDELKGRLWEESYWEPCWCTYLRNNKNAFDENNELMGWGCFTGEIEAEYFFQSHTVELQPGDYVLLFSDGMIPALKDDDFVKWLVENFDDTGPFQIKVWEKIHAILEGQSEQDKEKTVVLYRYEG